MNIITPVTHTDESVAIKRSFGVPFTNKTIVVTWTFDARSVPADTVVDGQIVLLSGRLYRVKRAAPSMYSADTRCWLYLIDVHGSPIWREFDGSARVKLVCGGSFKYKSALAFNNFMKYWRSNWE